MSGARCGDGSTAVADSSAEQNMCDGHGEVVEVLHETVQSPIDVEGLGDDRSSFLADHWVLLANLGLGTLVLGIVFVVVVVGTRRPARSRRLGGAEGVHDADTSER